MNYNSEVNEETAKNPLLNNFSCNFMPHGDKRRIKIKIERDEHENR